MDGDRQVVRTEPFVQAGRVARELEPLDAAGAAAGMRGPLRPLDEERQARLRHRLGDACEPPAQVAAGALGDLQTEPLSDGFDVLGANRPAERAAVGRRRDPAAEGAPGRLLLVDYIDVLEVAAVEWQDAIRRSPAGMAAAFDALVVEAADEYVVERDQAGRSARRTWSAVTIPRRIPSASTAMTAPSCARPSACSSVSSGAASSILKLPGSEIITWSAVYSWRSFSGIWSTFDLVSTPSTCPGWSITGNHG